MSAREVCGRCFAIEVGDPPEDEFPENPSLPVVAPPPAAGDTSGNLHHESSSSRFRASYDWPSVRSLGLAFSRIRFRSFLPRTRSKLVFAIVMTCYALILSRFLNTLVWASTGQSRPWDFNFDVHHPVLSVFLLILFAPLFETLQLVAVIELTRWSRAPEFVQIMAGAWVISLFHAKPWAPYAIIVFPAFCIQAMAYLQYRRSCWKDGFKAVVFIHALGNLMPAISVVGAAARLR